MARRRSRRVPAAVLTAALALGGLSASSAVRAAEAPSASAPAGGIPFRKDSTPGVDSPRWLLGVGAAIAAAAVALWWLQRRQSGRAAGPRTRRLALLETLRVSPRTALLLVEVDGRTLLLAEHANGVVQLSPETATAPKGPGDA